MPDSPRALARAVTAFAGCFSRVLASGPKATNDPPENSFSRNRPELTRVHRFVAIRTQHKVVAVRNYLLLEIVKGTATPAV